ncbi:IS1 family transposase [Dickeya zeae]
MDLTFRTRIKRLRPEKICFPHSIELHEEVIGVLIEKICSTNWRHYRKYY